MTTTTLTDWQKAEFAIKHSNRVLLYGLPGTGKTYFGLNNNTTNAYRLICTEEMTDADLIGCYKQNAQGTWSFAEGVGIKAWREGARLVVDEINRMNGDVENHPLLRTLPSKKNQKLSLMFKVTILPQNHKKKQLLS